MESYHPGLPEGTEQTLALQVPAGTPQPLAGPAPLAPGRPLPGTVCQAMLPPPPEEPAPAPGLVEGVSGVASRAAGTRRGVGEGSRPARGSHAFADRGPPSPPPESWKTSATGENAPRPGQVTRTSQQAWPQSAEELGKPGESLSAFVPLPHLPSALSPSSLVRVSQPGQSAHPPISVGRGATPMQREKRTMGEGRPGGGPRPGPDAAPSTDKSPKPPEPV